MSNVRIAIEADQLELVLLHEQNPGLNTIGLARSIYDNLSTTSLEHLARDLVWLKSEGLPHAGLALYIEQARQRRAKAKQEREARRERQNKGGFPLQALAHLAPQQRHGRPS